MDTKASAKSEFYTDEFETDYEDNLESEVICSKSLLPGLRSAEQHVLVLLDPYSAQHHVPKDTASMIEFDMMHFSPLTNSASTIVNQQFLMNAAN